MKQLLLSSCLFLTSAASGQTYFYIDNIGVDPTTPTTADNIAIQLDGNLSSTGAYVAFTSASVNGNTLTLTVNSADPGGLAVLVPHTEIIQIGQLAAGTYTIVIIGTATGDFAPQLQHSFIVIDGGSLAACDSLVFHSLQYAAYNDTAIEIVVSNPSSVLFAYPRFILFDDNGDTLAIETSNYFGIGNGPQTHTLIIHASATLPVGTFNGALELWAGIPTILACTLAINDDLCPPAPCSDAVVYIENTGGAIVVSGFGWSILDSLSIVVASGQLQLGNAQSDTSNVCLPPGNYTLVMSQPTPSGGQLYFGMGNGTGPLVQAPFIQGTTNSMDFSFYTHCIDTSTGIVPADGDNGMVVNMENGVLHVRAIIPLGVLRIYDAHGRLMLEQRLTGKSGTIDPGQLASGCYVLSQAQGNARSVRFVKP